MIIGWPCVGGTKLPTVWHLLPLSMGLSCVWACLGAGYWGQGYSNFRWRCVCGVSGWLLLWAVYAGGGVSGALSCLGALLVSSLPGPVPSTCLIPPAITAWRQDTRLKTTTSTRFTSAGCSNIYIFFKGTCEDGNFCSSTKTQDLQQLRPHHNSTQLWSLQVQEQAGHLHWIHNYFYILATCLIQFYNSSVIQNIASQFNLVQPCKLQEWS